jgi:hypothetical protein
VSLPKTADGWAIRFSQIVKIFHEHHGLDRFPIKVAAIAQDFSRNLFPGDPITLVEGRSFTKAFEGALIPKPGKKEWGIFYNSNISSPGRINFTLAHELGHYLLHRLAKGDAIHCVRRDMWEWDSAYARMEGEANQFAAQLLMPLDDFRLQTANFRKPHIDQFEVLAERYGVSLTAAILKWLEQTKARAMIVVSRDGFIDWARSSGPLLRSGVYFKARKAPIEVPAESLAAKPLSSDAATGRSLPAGIWWPDEPVFETVVNSEYHGMVISLLVFPPEASYRGQSLDASIA